MGARANIFDKHILKYLDVILIQFESYLKIVMQCKFAANCFSNFHNFHGMKKLENQRVVSDRKNSGYSTS